MPSKGMRLRRVRMPRLDRHSLADLRRRDIRSHCDDDASRLVVSHEWRVDDFVAAPSLMQEMHSRSTHADADELHAHLVGTGTGAGRVSTTRIPAENRTLAHKRSGMT